MNRPNFRIIAALALCVAFNAKAQPFAGMREAIESGGYGSIKAVLVSVRGELVYEEYFRGAQAGDLQQMHSVTKSIGSALIGIAHRQQLLSLDQGLSTFFGDLYPIGSGLYAGKQFITVEDVLQQRLGIAWDEWTLDYLSGQNPVYLGTSSGDWYNYVLTQTMDSQPGTKFAYNTLGSTLMSRMIRKSAGMSPRAFAMQELFGPLGISQFHWEGFSFEGMGYGLTNFPNPDGDEPLGFMLWLRPLDMLKIGEMYLNGGVYQGQRILDESWIEASWQRYSNSENTELFAANPDGGYGYQWWTTGQDDDRGRHFLIHYANGWARQYILVIPALDMVVVSVSDDYEYDGPGIGALMSHWILNETDPLIEINAGLNDAWVNANAPYQGMFLTVFPLLQKIFLAWFTFDTEVPAGDPAVFGWEGQRWVTALGSYEGGRAVLNAELTTGGSFNSSSPTPSQDTNFGTITIDFTDCGHGDLAFDFPSAGQTGAFTITRAVEGNTALCEALLAD